MVIFLHFAVFQILDNVSNLNVGMKFLFCQFYQFFFQMIIIAKFDTIFCKFSESFLKVFTETTISKTCFIQLISKFSRILVKRTNSKALNYISQTTK